MKFKSIEPYLIAVRLVTPVSLDRKGSVGIEIRLLAGRVRELRWFYDRIRSLYVLQCPHWRTLLILLNGYRASSPEGRRLGLNLDILLHLVVCNEELSVELN